MTTLSQVLSRYRTRDRVVFGSEAPATPVTPLNREGLREDINTVREANKGYFHIGIAMFVSLFIFLLVAIAQCMDKPERLQWLGLLGGGVGGSQLALLAFFRRWLKERSDAELLLVIVPQLPDDSLRNLVDKLWENSVAGGGAGMAIGDQGKDDSQAPARTGRI